MVRISMEPPFGAACGVVFSRGRAAEVGSLCWAGKFLIGGVIWCFVLK